MTKSRLAERKTIIYEHNCDNIQVGIDGTDHINFFCDKCHKVLEVIEVRTKRDHYSGLDKPQDYCTWVYLVCNYCHSLGKRKFYWSPEANIRCYKRTFKEVGDDGVE